MSEVNQAAERLRRLKDEPYTGNGAYPIGESENALDRLQNEDRRLLADAYLAEHLPDDDEPLSVEFLDTLSQRSVSIESGYCEWDLQRLVWARRFAGGCIEVRCHDLSLRRITTRGQLRQLLKALQ